MPDRDQIFPKVLDAIVVYYDRGKAYQRFVPLDEPPFRHGLSLNVALDGDVETARKVVAEWLTSAVLSLVEEG